MSIEKKDLPALHEETIAMSAALQKVATVDKKTGDIESPSDIYEKLAAEAGLTNGQDWAKFNTTFFAASAHATGELGSKTMAKNKDLTVAVARFPMIGKDSWEVKYTKSKEVNAGLPKEGAPTEKKTVYGQVTGVLDIYATGKVGEMSKVKQHLAAAAATLFS